MARSVRAWFELTLAVVLALPACAAFGQDPNRASPAPDPRGAMSSWPEDRPPTRSVASRSSLRGGDFPLPPVRSSRLYEPAETVGRVGEHFIFRGDLIGDANLIMAAALEKATPEELEQNRAQIEQQRDAIAQQLLRQVIDRKLMYIEFLRSIPSDKLKEVKSNIDKKIGDAFQEDLDDMLQKVQAAKEEEYRELSQRDNQLFRLALIMKQNNLTSPFELDRTLRKYDSSLRQQQQAYLERKLGQQQLYQSIEFRPEVTHEEMLDYYRAQQPEFQVPTRARWEQLTARFDKFPSKEACGEAIAEMGNEVVLGGAPFWAVAKRRSQDPNADKGGYQDWKPLGDLSISRAIIEAVFSLPVKQMSGIIEDFEGLHIVRVIERTEAHVIPFTEAQVEIKEKLQQQKRSEEIAAYLVRLRSRTPIWTIYDGEDPTREAGPREAVQPELNR